MAGKRWRDDKRKTTERGYGWQWQQARELYLQAHPLCVMCERMTPPRITAACVVDHRIPHRGDPRLFWDRSNWQALCKLHHDSDKQALEKSGHAPQQIGLDGFPIEAPAGPE
jgi:5-methylcytosine-specific restriction enzyme A